MGWFVFVLIIVYLIYRALSSASKPQPISYFAAPAPSSPMHKTFRADFKKEVNDLINGMRCGRCNTGETPTYNNKNGNENINCCCEPFLKEITDRIEAHFSTSRVSCKMTYHAKEMSHSAARVSTPLNGASIAPGGGELHPQRLATPIEENIFVPFRLDKLGNEEIHDAIRAYDHTIVAYYIGALESGKKYALIIGTSAEWVNVITYNWAKEPVYQQYGFSILEKRWSYGNKILGAPQIRDVINAHLQEIHAVMSTQEDARRIKAEERLKREAEEEKMMLEEEAHFNATQQIRKQIIDRCFTGLHFKIIASELDDKVSADENNCYYNVCINNQFCSCSDFSNLKKFPEGDIRRLCRHLREIMNNNSLFHHDSVPICNYILQTSWGNLLGIYYGQLQNQMPYAILTYSWTLTVFVVMPNASEDKFTTVKWNNENGRWVTSKRNYNDEIYTELTNLLPC